MHVTRMALATIRNARVITDIAVSVIIIFVCAQIMYQAAVTVELPQELQTCPNAEGACQWQPSPVKRPMQPLNAVLFLHALVAFALHAAVLFLAVHKRHSYVKYRTKLMVAIRLLSKSIVLFGVGFRATKELLLVNHRSAVPQGVLAHWCMLKWVPQKLPDIVAFLLISNTVYHVSISL